MRWRQRDSDFARYEATTAATKAMEDEALRRALEGVEKLVFYRGRQVGSFRSYNDRLLIRLLERRRPSADGQEALRKVSPTVSIPAPAPILSPTVSVPASPRIPSPTVSIPAREPILSPAVSVPALALSPAPVLSPTVSVPARPGPGDR